MQKKNIPFCLLLLLIISCNREDTPQQTATCINQTQTPLPGYQPADFVPVIYNESICGYLPLNKNNYWVYLDSTFNDNGQFVSRSIDTVRFKETFRTPDGLIWWRTDPNNFGTLQGYHMYMYVTDSAVYSVNGNLGGLTAFKWIHSIPGDSLNNWCTYTDYSSVCNVKKMPGNVSVPAGNFPNCMWYLKKTFYGGYGIEIWFKPGLGTLKSRILRDSAPYTVVRNSTLLAYHLE